MTSVKSREVISGLTSKGFRAHDNNHTFLVLYVGDRKTSVRTKVSHGSRDIGEPLIQMMAKQTKLSKREFLDLIDCRLTGEEYLAKLRQKGISF